MKKAFTIIELLVAMALLAMLIAISGMVFSTAVKAHRTANAAAEVAAKLFALTDQLNRDFQGLRKDMPAAIWFEYDSNTGKRYDQIQFFADGTFSSSRQWGGASLEGNTARVYYGHANNVKIVKSTSWQRTPDATRYYNSTYFTAKNTPNFYRERGTKAILARRAHLSVQLSSLATFPDATNFSNAASQTAFIPWLTNTSTGYGNDVFEYDNISLSDWTNILASPTNATQYLNTCFNNATGRPGVDLTASDGESLHMVMVQGIGSFSIQLAYTSDDMRLRGVPDSDLNRPGFAGIRWWPSLDANGDGNASDSDFGTAGMNAASFGCYMQFPSTPTLTGWYGTSGCLTGTTWRFKSDYFPKALKFTFTLYDSNGVFKDGKTFTHIVYFN